MKSARFLLLFILFYIPLYAYTQHSNINIYGSGAYEIPYGDFAHEDIYNVSGNADEGSSINLGSQCHIYNAFFIGVESAYNKFGPGKKVANHDIYASSISLIINISHYFKQGDFRPYAAFGTGVSRTTLTMQTEISEESSTQTVALININTGCDMMITDHAALFCFVRWSDGLTKNKSFTYRNFHTLTPKFNFTFIGLGLGYKYWFK